MSPAFTKRAAERTAPTHVGVQSQRAICMSGNLISEAAEAVILTLYSWKVIESVRLARETQVPHPRLSRAYTEGNTSGVLMWTQCPDTHLVYGSRCG